MMYNTRKTIKFTFILSFTLSLSYNTTTYNTIKDKVIPSYISYLFLSPNTHIYINIKSVPHLLFITIIKFISYLSFPYNNNEIVKDNVCDYLFRR